MKKKKGMGVFGASVLFVLFMFLTVLYTVLEAKFMFAGEPEDIYDMISDEGKPQEGEYVSIKVDAVVDWYAEPKHTINGFIPAGKEKHCIIWLDDDEFISMTIKGKKNIEKIDNLVDDTWDYINGYAYSLPEPVEFKGKIEPLSGEVLGYYRDAIRAMGANTGEFTVYEMTLDTTETKFKSILILCSLVALDALGIFLIVSAVKRKREPEMPQMANMNGVTPDMTSTAGMNMADMNNMTPGATGVTEDNTRADAQEINPQTPDDESRE